MKKAFSPQHVIFRKRMHFESRKSENLTFSGVHPRQNIEVRSYPRVAPFDMSWELQMLDASARVRLLYPSSMTFLTSALHVWGTYDARRDVLKMPNYSAMPQTFADSSRKI